MGRGLEAIAAAAAMALAAPALAQPDCQTTPPLPAPTRAPLCRFLDDRLAFAGSPREQALCLTPLGDPRRFAPRASLGQPLDRLVGADASVDRMRLLSLLRAAGMAYPQDALARGVSRAGGADAPAARYFVIHDTSGARPGRSFPPDDDPRLNRLGTQYCDGSWTAHAYVNRVGRAFFAYDFSVPWRATKFESANGARRGLFLHVELNQPRRPGRGEGLEDATLTPDPAFTSAQYRTLALLYVAASARAGRWLIPAFHSAIDSAWDDGHDDPRGFELDRFDDALAQLLAQLGR